MNRRLLILVFIGALFVVGLVIGLWMVFEYENSTSECTTTGCMKAASKISKNINPKINPCDNFYDFACGGYLASALIPDGEHIVHTYTEIDDEIKMKLRTGLEEPISPDEPRLFKLVKTLYKNCMDTPDIKDADFEPLRRILEQYGKWPVVEGERWQEDGFDWKESVLMSRRLGFSVNNFFSLDIDIDMKNTSRYILGIKKANLGSLRRNLAKGIDDDEVQIYFKRMVEIATYLGADEERAARELKESLNFEIQLASPTWGNEFYVTISELDKQYPFMNWTEYINNLLPPNTQVDANEVVTVSSSDSISYLEELLKNTSKRVQANYALWKVVDESLKFLTKNGRNKQMGHVFTTSKNITMDRRWKECVGNISGSSLSTITNALYVRKYFDKATRDKIIEMVTDLKEEMVKNLEKVDWMDNETRIMAVERSKSIRSLVAYPVELLDDNVLEKFYSDLKLRPDDFLGNVLQSNKIRLNYSLGLLKKSVNKTEWVRHDYSTTVNAFYDPSSNVINIPAGTLQGAYFSHDRPRYMNYGAIGFLVGHEISHSFDPEGKKFDKDGNDVGWWTLKAGGKYYEKVDCITNQYSNYTVESVGLKLDGEMTLAENVADNSGVKLAYLAYKEYVKRNGPELKLPGLKYTSEQIFWISAASIYCEKLTLKQEKLMNEIDDHAPGRFRVIGTFGNSPEFAADFNCPSGSYMNPVTKCTVL